MAGSRVVTDSLFPQWGEMDLFPNWAERGVLNPKASSVSYTIDSPQPLPSHPPSPTPARGVPSAMLGHTAHYSWDQRFSLDREGTENSGRNCLTFLLWTHDWIPKRALTFSPWMQPKELEGWSKDSTARKSALTFLPVCLKKYPDASLQRKASKDTTLQTTLFKYRAHPQTQIVSLGTDAFHTKRCAHHFHMTSAFQGKNNRWGKRDNRVVFILIPLIKICPKLPPIKFKDASSKSSSKILASKKVKGCHILEFCGK